MCCKNIGPIDRLVRVVLGLVFAYLGYYYNPWWYIGTVVMAITALTGFCLLYKIFGISTCKNKEGYYKKKEYYAKEEVAEKRPAKKKPAKKAKAKKRR